MPTPRTLIHSAWFDYVSVGADIEIHCLENPPFPMTEFTLKAKRIQYAAGNPAMVAKLREIVGR